MIVIIGKRELNIENKEELVSELDRLNEIEEVSISGHGTTSMLILFNSQSSFLIYFRFQDGDHGFQSVDLGRDRNKNEEFILSNGQLDIYPLHFLRTRKEGIDAIIYYFQTGHMTPQIDWISQTRWTV
jgi:hypothetical protein